ncbi:unnamed protein product [Didymodactylos carnosus]|uniref:Protein NO VEIN C-terminal domain-containing protein n=1 Tax=Didymodactylos carnosus TaxID=1234261 RepID=A0A814TBD7_9BILA|nr:unnamed protein product [Didymodactylos carnosus]CAF3922566.1 unnamed protein product [Didymodactylos carnosus]
MEYSMSPTPASTIVLFEHIETKLLTVNGICPDIVHHTNDDQSCPTKSDWVTGRWGEELVYNYLKWKHRSQGKNIHITWLNETSESGEPYDIIIEDSKNTCDYIEVKSTVSNHCHAFPISIEQVSWFMKLKNNYYIYRVYNVFNKQQVCIRILNNLRENLHKHYLSLEMKINDPNPINNGDTQ